VEVGGGERKSTVAQKSCPVSARWCLGELYRVLGLGEPFLGELKLVLELVQGFLEELKLVLEIVEFFCLLVQQLCPQPPPLLFSFISSL
jgi:hypothetical protein